MLFCAVRPVLTDVLYKSEFDIYQRCLSSLHGIVFAVLPGSATRGGGVGYSMAAGFRAKHLVLLTGSRLGVDYINDVNIARLPLPLSQGSACAFFREIGYG